MRVSLVIDGDASGAKGAAQQASTAIRDLGAAANEAKTETVAAGAANDNLAKSLQVLRGLESELEKAVADVNVGLVAQRNGTNAAANSHGGLSVQAMAAQHSIRSMVEQIALGMPPTQILTGQLNHLSFAASGPGGLSGAFKEAAGSLLGVITPTTLVVGGLAGLAAGAVLAVHSVVQSSKALDDLARATDQPVSKLHGLQQAMSFKGISNEDFTKGITEFADKVFEAQHNTGSLNSLMIANGKSAKDLSGYMSSVADLVARASSDIQKQKILREAGLPSDAAWVRFMEQGGNGIQAAINGTVQFNNAAEANLVRKAREFDDAWNRTTTKLVANFKAATIDMATALSNVTVPDWLKTLADKALTFAPVVGPVYQAGKQIAGALGVGAAPNFADRFGSFDKATPALQSALNSKAGIVEPKTKEEIERQNQLVIQRIQLLGQLASVNDQVKAKELELDNARNNGISLSDKQRDSILNLTRAQAELNRVQQQASLGIFDVAKARQAANDQLRVAIDSGLVDSKNTQQMAAAQTALAKSLEETADAARVAGAALPQFQQALNEAGSARKQLDSLAVEGMSVNRSFFTDIGQNLRSGNGWWNSFANAGLNALGRLSDKLTQMAADKLFANAFGGSSGGLASLFGLGGGSVGDYGQVANATGLGAGTGGISFPMFDGGGYTGRGGKYEPKGIVHGGEYVFDQDSVNSAGVGFFSDLHRRIRGYAGGGFVGNGGSGAGLSAGGMKLDIGVTFDNSGEFRSYVKSVSTQSASDTLGSYIGSPQFVDHVGAAATQAQTERKFK